MKTIWTHPDNAEILRRRLHEEDLTTRGSPAPFMLTWPDWSIKTNNLLERERHSGKYILDDGRIVEKNDVRLVSRFVSYGPEDIHFLLYAGLIREHMELLFHVVDELAFRMTFDYRPLVSTRPVLLSTCF